MTDQRNCHWCGANVPELQRENARLLARVEELEREIERLSLALLKAHGAQTKVTTVDQ